MLLLLPLTCPIPCSSPSLHHRFQNHAFCPGLKVISSSVATLFYVTSTLPVIFHVIDYSLSLWYSLQYLVTRLNLFAIEYKHHKSWYSIYLNHHSILSTQNGDWRIVQCQYIFSNTQILADSYITRIIWI